MDEDPTVMLAEIRELLAQDRHSELARDDVGAVLGRIEALDKWLSNGGRPPADWCRGD